MLDWIVLLIASPGKVPAGSEHLDLNQMQIRGWIVKFGKGYKATDKAIAFLRSNSKS